MSSSGSSRRSPAPHLSKRVGKYFVGRTIGEVGKCCGIIVVYDDQFYVITFFLGGKLQGTYAKVKYAQHTETGEAVAIKILNKDDLISAGMVEQLKREINILKQIRHPHVVNLKEIMSSREKIYMVLELVTGGDLFDKIAAEGPLKEPEARILFAQIVSALSYCHARGIFHRDLKPENVLLTSEGDTKLSDFGLGVLLSKDELSDPLKLLYTICGTPNYAAPEVLAKRGYQGGAADIWSMGVVLYVMLAGCLPFDEEDLPTLVLKIERAEFHIPPWVSSDATDILCRMLTADWTKRASLIEVENHPWLSGLVKRPSMDIQRNSLLEDKSLMNVFTGSNGSDITDSDVFSPAISQTNFQGSTQEVSNSNLVVVAADGAPQKLNAFQLINDYLDISAIFEAKDDLVTRHTRFSSLADPAVLLNAIENAAVAIGGRVEKRTTKYVRLYIPTIKGPLRVTANLLEVLPGKRIVDLAKVSGDTPEFYKWYPELAAALEGLTTDEKRIMSARSRGPQPTLRRRLNAFELICSNINLATMFDLDEDHSSGHVQFSSRAPPEKVIEAFSEAVRQLDGRMITKNVDNWTRRAEIPVGKNKLLRLRLRMFELLRGVLVVQLVKEFGSMLDLYKMYNKMVAGPLETVMMRRKDGRIAHPRASNAPSLASTSALSFSGVSAEAVERSLATISRQSSHTVSDQGDSYGSKRAAHELPPLWEGPTAASQPRGG